MQNLKLALELTGKDNASDVVRRFERNAKSSAASISRSFISTGEHISRTTKYVTALGTAFATWQAKKAVQDSAALDKELIRVGQTAGATKEQVGNLRKELFSMGQQTGQSVNDLLAGVNNLVQSGQSWDESVAIIKAMNPAMAVTGSNANTLAAALGVAKQNFNFDLSKVETSKLLLDQMTVAGRQGNAELENLSDIFARVGSNAKTANLSFVDTLAFVEQLSKSERQPERLATLADSTLRLFTNGKYMAQAAKATKVKFYNTDGSKRAPLDILEDIQKKYAQQKTDKQRDIFMAKAFAGADLDTIRGLRMALDKGALLGMRDMANQIQNAGGTIDKDLSGALNNAIDQTDRLKNALRDAADEFSKPINASLSQMIQYSMDEKKLTGKDMLVGGAVLAGGSLLAGRVAGGVLGSIGKHIGGTAAGVAEGKVLEAAAGITPVFVTNWPNSLGNKVAEKATDKILDKAGTLVTGAAGGGALAWLRMMAGQGIARGALGAAAGIAGTAAAGSVTWGGTGYLIGKYAVNPAINWATSKMAGHEASPGTLLADYMMARERDRQSQQVGGELKLTIDSQVPVRVQKLQQKGGMGISIFNGPYMPGAGG